MRYFVLGTLCLISVITNGQARTELSDFQNLDDTTWIGELMYVNYSDGKEVKLRSSMEIQIDDNKIILHTRYLDEPSANGTDTIKIRKDGRYLGNEELIEKTMENDALKFTTRFKGRDNNLPAMIYKYFTISDTQYEVIKKVVYIDSQDSLIRNTYSYVKQNQ